MSDCSGHPDAPHGFDRNASHDEGRYVCDCEGWMPPDCAGWAVLDPAKKCDNTVPIDWKADDD